MEKVSETLKRIADNVSIKKGKGQSPPLPPGALPGPGRPDCPICHGVGYIKHDVPVYDPNFGKLYPCTCRLEEVQNAQDEQLQRLASLGPLSDKTFDNFLPQGHATDQAQRDSLQRAYDYCRTDFAEMPQPRGWVFLLGGYGSGKTHLAAAIANERLSRGEPVVFATVPDLLDHLRATFSPNSAVQYDEMFERVRNIPLLVLDDLGAESATPWAQEKLYQIINHRYAAKLPTVITSNVELERIDPRIRSRLVDMDLVRKILINAPDFRRADADMEQNDLTSLRLHHSQTFENFNLRQNEVKGKNQKMLKVALAAAQAFAQDPQGWLIFTGDHGLGKTHLAAAIANDRVRNGHPALFVTVADLLDHLRATFSPDSLVRYDKRFTEVRNAPMLVLDNLTLESATPWATEKLKQLLDHRYIAHLPTIITTTVDTTDMGPWFETRLLDPRLSTICPIIAPIYKGKGRRHANKKP